MEWAEDAEARARGARDTEARPGVPELASYGARVLASDMAWALASDTALDEALLFQVAMADLDHGRWCRN